VVIGRIESVGVGGDDQFEQLLGLLWLRPRGLKAPLLVELGQQPGRGNIHARQLQPARNPETLDLESQRLARGALRLSRGRNQA